MENWTVTLSPQTLVALASLLAAIGAILKYYNKAYDFSKHQSEQDRAIAEIAKKHEEDIREVREEQSLVIYGILSCLKGLQEQGCDGAVADAIDKFEKFLNQAAHGQR